MSEHRKYGKSRIAIKRGSTLQNRENGPNKENKRVYSKKVIKSQHERFVPSQHERKTLSSKNGDNVQENPGVRLKRAKTAPDFSKLHMEWEAKLAKGKAVTKRPNTKIEPFALTKEVNEKPDDSYSEEDLLTTEVPETIITVTEECKIVEEIPPACCTCGKPKQAKSPEQEFKVPRSIRKTTLSSLKKKKKVEFEEELLEFKTDSKALQSILNNDGIISTTPSRKTFGFWRSPVNQKRTSIYYTGPRRDRSPGAFEKRLSIRRTAALMAKKQAQSSFQPLETFVGVQEIGSKFNSTTTPLEQSSNDFLTHAECIPEETEKTPESMRSDGAVGNEISWADTLKYYSQPQPEIFSRINNESQEEQIESKKEDQEALLAQLEEEVRRTLKNAALEEKAEPPREQCPVLSSSWSKTEFTESQNVSIPLQQRREKPSIYRKLFASPFSARIENRQKAVPAPNADWHPGSKHTEMNHREAVFAPNIGLNPGYIHPDKHPTTREGVLTSSANLNLGNTHAMKYGREASNSSLNSGYPTTTALLEPSNISYASAGIVERAYETTPTSLCRSGLEDLYRPRNERLRYLPSEPEYPSERISEPIRKAETSPFVNKYLEGNLPHNRGIHGSDLQSKNNTTSNLAKPKINNVMGISGVSFRTSALIGGRVPEAITKETNEGCKDLTLLAAASASLNSKLRKKAIQTKSAFQEVLPPSLELVRHSSATNACTPVGAQKILAPTPMRAFANDDDVLQNSSAYFSRPREIIREAKAKSQDHTQLILLDAEVSQYTWGIGSLRKDDCHLRLINPVAKLFNEGDERHFVPLLPDDEIL